jgi:hypothetical protein
MWSQACWSKLVRLIVPSPVSMLPGDRLAMSLSLKSTCRASWLPCETCGMTEYSCPSTSVGGLCSAVQPAGAGSAIFNSIVPLVLGVVLQVAIGFRPSPVSEVLSAAMSGCSPALSARR